ncbi:DNA primase [Mycoplasma elephantis]|uniref:DNA primase n=1 Tax=Mycoplasma elephantis TaxID=114882 RepID=UPI00068C36A6|nr:DNA primase [Mycoplasma elephantis]
MKYSRELIDEIKNKNDIVEVIGENISLQKRGSNYIGLCPFHDDKNPSLSISQEKQIFKCFSCGTSGNVIKFIELYNNIRFLEALKNLAIRANIDCDFSSFVEDVEFDNYTQEQYKLISCLNDATTFFNWELQKNENAMNYLQSRGITNDIIGYFKIGFANGDSVIKEMQRLKYEDYLIEEASLCNEFKKPILWNRIVFPIKDEFSYVVGYSARSIDNNQTKYINSKESAVFIKNKILFNYERAHIIGIENKELFITEGFMDVIALHKANIKNCVALMGTTLTQNHSRLLKPIPKIVMFLDGDDAGQNATFKSLEYLVKNNFKVEVVDNNTKLDPDELFNKMTVEEFVELTNKRLQSIDWIYKYLLNFYGITKENYETIGSNIKIKFVKHFNEFLKFETRDTYKYYTSLIANEFKISKDLFEEAPIENHYRPIYLEKKIKNFDLLKSRIKIQNILILFLKLNPKFLKLLSKTIDDNTLINPFNNEFFNKYIELCDNIRTNPDKNMQHQIANQARLELEDLKNKYNLRKDIKNIFSIFWNDMDSEESDPTLLKEFWQLYSRALLESITDEIQTNYNYSIKEGTQEKIKESIHKKINDLKKKQEKANYYIKRFSE